MLRQADPFLGTVEEALVLPDRDLRLEVVDQTPRCGESLCTALSTASTDSGVSRIATSEGTSEIYSARRVTPTAIAGRRRPLGWLP